MDDIDNMDYDLPTQPMAGPSASTQQRGSSAAVSYASVPANSDEHKRWICIYPIYIDADRSYAKGRKVRTDKAVKEPRAAHMQLAIARLGLQTVLEPSAKHPRDFFNPGRVRVRLFDDKGRPIQRAISTRKQLLARISAALAEAQADTQLMKSLPPHIGPGSTIAEITAATGQAPMGMGALGFADEDDGGGSGSAATEKSKGPAPSAGSSSGGSKKKGKKGRR